MQRTCPQLKLDYKKSKQEKRKGREDRVIQDRARENDGRKMQF